MYKHVCKLQLDTCLPSTILRDYHRRTEWEKSVSRKSNIKTRTQPWHFANHTRSCGLIYIIPPIRLILVTRANSSWFILSLLKQTLKTNQRCSRTYMHTKIFILSLSCKMLRYSRKSLVCIEKPRTFFLEIQMNFFFSKKYTFVLKYSIRISKRNMKR